MRTTTAWALALLFLALPSLPPAGAAPPDRPPHANAGSDLTVKEGTVVLIDAGQTYDNDPSDTPATLKYKWRTTPTAPDADPDHYCDSGPPAVPASPTPGFHPACSNAAGFAFATLPVTIFSTTPPVNPPTASTGGQCREALLTKGSNAWESKFTAPAIGVGPLQSCTYRLDVQVNDGKGYYNYDSVVVTVTNENTAPTFSDKAFTMNTAVCTGKVLNSVDLLQNHGGTIAFCLGTTTLPVTDDKSTVAALAVLTLAGADPEHHITVDMKTKTYISGGGGTPETSRFEGTLPIDTPDLLAGDYDVAVTAFDAEGGAHSAGQTYTLSVSAPTPTGAPNPQCPTTTFPSENGPWLCLFNDRTTSFTPNSCFSGGTAEAPRALGQGQTLRFQVQADTTQFLSAPVYPDDPNLLLWKVTYQSCVLASDNNPAYGREIPMKSPYFMSLDTLFSGDQEVAVRAYDRLGNVATTVVIPLTTDLSRPTFMVDWPETTYQRIPFHPIVYVQDRVQTQVVMHMKGPFGDEATKRCVNRATAANQCDPGVTSFILPPLARMVRTDIYGTHTGIDVCQFLFDDDGDGVLDHYFDAYGRTVGRLIDVPALGGTYSDYVVDANSNGAADNGEVLIPGSATQVVQYKDFCRSPFSPPYTRPSRPDMEAFLNRSSTQVFIYDLTRYPLGRAEYVLQISDTVFNRFAADNYRFNYTLLGYKFTSQNQTLSGTFHTDKAYVDLGIVDVKGTRGGYLPGDTVTVNVNVTYHSPLRPQPLLPLFVCIADHPASANFTEGLKVCIVHPSTCETVGTVAPDAIVPIPVTRPYNATAFCDARDITPEQRTQLRLGYDPGVHSLVATVALAPVYNATSGYFFAFSLNETVPQNNTATGTFEVYLGKVVVGSYAAADKATGRVFYVRADSQGLPMAGLGRKGVVELDEKTGNVTAYHDMVFDQSGDAAVYRFDYTEKGELRRGYWDPQARTSMTYGKDCSRLSSTEARIVRDALATETSPRCRPITVESAQTVSTTTTSKSPGFEAIAAIGAVALLAFAVRRRRAA